LVAIESLSRQHFQRDLRNAAMVALVLFSVGASGVLDQGGLLGRIVWLLTWPVSPLVPDGVRASLIHASGAPDSGSGATADSVGSVQMVMDGVDSAFALALTTGIVTGLFWGGLTFLLLRWRRRGA
jgi:hypothetical protein